MTPSAPRCGLVGIVGRPNVGKSTLLNRLVGEKVAIVSSKPQTTRNRILGVVNRPGGQIALLDTPGIHRPLHRMNRRMMDAALATLGQVDVVLWMVDVTEPPGGGDAYVRDLLAKPRVLPAIETYRGMLDFAEIVPLSALQGDNVERLAELLLGYLPEGPPLYPADYLTDQPERFLAAEMVRERILENTRQELPYTSGVVVDSFEEGERLVRIHVTILVERDGQKAILIGRGGQMLKKVGTEARRSIETLLGTKVFLKLFVKVRPRWREDPRMLEEVGIRGKD